MSLYLEKEYVNRLRPKLPGFTQKSDFLWNFRCPVCGDSKKNKHKMRGYIYRRKNDLFFSCHNCNTTWPFLKLLSYIDPALHTEYKIESLSFAEKKPEPTYNFEKPVFKKDVVINLPSVNELTPSHFARRYVENRQIPKEFWDNIYYADEFKDFITEFLPDHENEFHPREKRIVFPFFDEKKNILGVQGRDLLGGEVKYISVKLNPDVPKVFGLERLDTTKPILVVEGPIDSMFLDNAVASMDSNLPHVIRHIGADKEYIFIYDNQPRNKAIVNSMRKSIDVGHNVVIWPDAVTEKDINDMILSGRTKEDILRMIKNRTYEGLRAKLEFDKWRKC